MTTSRERDLLQEIRTRGSWEVVVRPGTFIQHRIDRLDLFDLVARSSIDIRGWDFPHIDRQDSPHIDVEWIGQLVDWEHIRQLWRAYRSGQFVWISGIPYEWRDRSGLWRASGSWSANTALDIGDTIARATEVCLFAARFSQTAAGDETMVISMTLKHMEGRVLFTDSVFRAPLLGAYRASVPEIVLTRTVPRVDLVARARAIALEFAAEIFSFFGWKPRPEIAADVQREFLRGPA